MSTDIKLSKAQISKIIQSGGFLGSLLSKKAGPLIKVVVQLTKNILAPLGITAAASAIDAGIQKKIHVSGATILIISNEEMNDIMKIVQALEDSNILLKGVTETIKNGTKEQKGGFLNMLLGTLGASLLGNLLSRKGIVRAGEGIVRAGYGSSIKKSLIPPHIKTKIFRIQADNSIVCGCFCIGFIDFMFAERSLIDFTSLFSPYDFKKNDDMILSNFK